MYLEPAEDAMGIIHEPQTEQRDEVVLPQHRHSRVIHTNTPHYQTESALVRLSALS